MSSNLRRVVITGSGLVSPLGNSPEQLWTSLASGASGVAPLANLPAADSPFAVGAECSEFTGHIQDFGPLEKKLQRTIRKGTKLMCREIQTGVAAAQSAIRSAGLEDGGYDPERAGVCFGCDYIITEPSEFIDGMRQCQVEGKVEYSRWATEGLSQVTPLWLLKFLPNMPASHIAIYNDLRGPSNSITMRESAANASIAEATAAIGAGRAEMIVAGATGSRLHALKSVHIAIREQIADLTSQDDPAALSRPFDRDRTGMVFGEGAGALVLESLESAQKRGAQIWGEVAGAGASAVLDRKAVGNLRQALTNAARTALQSAKIEPSELGHIHAHGLGTKHSDREEAKAIVDLFGSPDQQPPVVAAKGNFGHLGAGSGAVELIASLVAMNRGTLFPIRNLDQTDPECQVNAATAESAAGSSVLNLSTTPQGQATALVIRQFSP